MDSKQIICFHVCLASVLSVDVRSVRWKFFSMFKTLNGHLTDEMFIERLVDVRFVLHSSFSFPFCIYYLFVGDLVDKFTNALLPEVLRIKWMGNGHERKDNGYLPNAKRINANWKLRVTQKWQLLKGQILSVMNVYYSCLDPGVRACLHCRASLIQVRLNFNFSIINLHVVGYKFCQRKTFYQQFGIR